MANAPKHVRLRVFNGHRIPAHRTAIMTEPPDRPQADAVMTLYGSSQAQNPGNDESSPHHHRSLFLALCNFLSLSLSLAIADAARLEI